MGKMGGVVGPKAGGVLELEEGRGHWGGIKTEGQSGRIRVPARRNALFGRRTRGRRPLAVNKGSACREKSARAGSGLN